MVAVSAAILVTTAAACTGGSDAVDVPGADVSTSLTTPEANGAANPSASSTTSTVPVTTSTTIAGSPASTAPAASSPTTAAPTTAAPPDPATPAPTAAPASSGVLRQGDEGPRVGLMQFKLSILGYLPAGSDSGVFDATTNAAVLKFQGDYGLVVDGLVGPETERAINAAAESINPEAPTGE